MCGIHVAVSATRIPEIADGLKKSLCCRGPDFLGYTTRTVLRSGLPDISIHCTSTVLALRGDHITKQPLEDADSGSLLCWNGEAWKFDDQPVEGNDGEGLFARLGAIKEVRLDARRDSFLDVLRLVKGPFALVYFDAVGKCLYYARDRLGRRSLLVHTEGQGETLVLASVAGAAEPDWKEVAADGTYAIYLDETPEVSGPALSASRHSWTPSEEADLVSAMFDFWEQTSWLVRCRFLVLAGSTWTFRMPMTRSTRARLPLLSFTPSLQSH
jgi:asparagine synthetase B (glutamine-hydrolysing)